MSAVDQFSDRMHSHVGGVNFSNFDVSRAPVTNSLPACKEMDLTCQPCFFHRFKALESERCFVSSSRNKKALAKKEEKETI